LLSLSISQKTKMVSSYFCGGRHNNYLCLTAVLFVVTVFLGLCVDESCGFVTTVIPANQQTTRARTTITASVVGSYRSQQQQQQQQRRRRQQGFNLKHDRGNNIRIGDTRLHNRLLEFLSVYESKIPEELKEEIYQAEANTEAAKDRGKRVALYTTLAIFGIGLASFNGFLTELRSDGSSSLDMSILEQSGFGWVPANPIFKFLFTNKIGGVLCLLFGGGSGLLAEAEFDTKRLNSEKIYEELERRREQRIKKKQKNTGKVATRSKKMRQSGKEKKRIGALSEVVMDDDADKISTTTTAATTTTAVSDSSDSSLDLDKEETPVAAVDDETKETSAKEDDGNEDQSILGKMKDLYEKADSMAASQALIMNKNLEDAGVVEKITDASGLRVIGREEAKKFLEKKSKRNKNKK
jgi:hypothetical protein